MEKVGAVEPLAVGLDHGDPVLSPLEYLHLVHREDVGPGEVSLSVDKDCAIEHIQTDHLIEVRVLVSEKMWVFYDHPVIHIYIHIYLEYNERNPDLSLLLA